MERERLSINHTKANNVIVNDEESCALTRGMPLAALSSKYLEGLKKSPYCSDHFLRLAYTCFGPTKSAQKRRPPLQKEREMTTVSINSLASLTG